MGDKYFPFLAADGFPGLAGAVEELIDSTAGGLGGDFTGKRLLCLRPGGDFWGLTSLKHAGSNGAMLTTGPAGVGAEGSLVVVIETSHRVMDMNSGAWVKVPGSQSLIL